MKERNHKIDFRNAISIFLVVLVHASNDIYVVDDNYINLPLYSKMIHIVIYLLSSLSVPFFFMCTGYFALDKTTTFETVMKKRIVPLMITYAIWVVINNVFYSIFFDQKLNVIKIIMEILFLRNSKAYLWYIPALIGFYIISPILSRFFSSIDMKNYKYLFYVFLGFLCISSYKMFSDTFDLISISSPIQIFSTSSTYIFYVVLGKYFKDYIEGNSSVRKSLFMSLLTFLILIMEQLVLFNVGVKTFIYTDPIFLIFSYFSFVLLYCHILKSNQKKVVEEISSMTLGIYLVHRPIMYIMSANVFILSKPITIVVLSLVVFILSVFIVKILRKINMKYII